MIDSVSFPAGRLQLFRNSWTKITTDQTILEWIDGYRIPFSKRVMQRGPPTKQKWPKQEIELMTDQIDKLKGKAVIKEVAECKGQFLSSVFLVPKSSGGHRLVLNLKNLNEFVNTQHFKLEDGKTVQNMLSPGYFMASLDIQDAYYLIAINERDKKYLRFRFQGKLYQFECMPFGLNTAPYVFTKLMKPVMAFLRAKGLMSVIYLDDILMLGSSLETCLENVQQTKALLESLGFLINTEKSVLIPSTRCTFLGLLYDSELMSVELPITKIEKVGALIKKVRTMRRCKIRDFASFIGTLESCCPTLRYGRVHMRKFERARFLALKRNGEIFEKVMEIPSNLSDDLDWWSRSINNARNHITSFDPKVEIFSDASLSGWGAACSGKQTHGFWNEEEQSFHINRLELKAALFALKCFANGLRDCDILLRTDNTTTVAYINKKGGVQFPKLNEVAREIWDWCEHRNLWLFASYIRSEDNKEADLESRKLEPETEYSLAIESFERIVERFGSPEIDIFASRTNCKCRKYISWKKDPGAWAIDAFTVKWDFFFYAFPPFSIILRTLRKIRTEKCEGILVVPYWPAQPWFPIFESILKTDPILFKPDFNLLQSLNREPHPLWKTLTLVAGLLSSKH